jgi:hypothetical protein
MQRVWAKYSTTTREFVQHKSRNLGVHSLDRAARLAENLASWAADARRSANFLRGLLEFEARPDDLWIATYPRSGTTWSQYLLLLLHCGIDVRFEHIHDVSPWFERSLALGTQDARSLAALPSPRIFKTHLPASWVPRGGRVIHISRDGRDVASSYFQLYCDYLGYRGSFDQFFERFLRGDLQYRSWFDFECGWHARHHETNVLGLRYEIMRADPRGALQEIAQFCGIRRSMEEFDALVQAASIENMKRIASRFDHAELLLRERGIRSPHFIRSGRVGDGAKSLTLEQEAAFRRQLQRAERLQPRTELRIAAFLE